MGFKVPDQCVVLRWGGVMTLLDMEKGVEQFLASEVECFWLSDATKVPANSTTAVSYILPSLSMGHSELPCAGRNRQAVNMVEMPWWAYGVRGMELWFPSSLSEPLSPRRIPSTGHAITGQLDPELEFDREVRATNVEDKKGSCDQGFVLRRCTQSASLWQMQPSLESHNASFVHQHAIQIHQHRLHCRFHASLQCQTHNLCCHACFVDCFKEELCR